MIIVVASDSFKGTLSSKRIGELFVRAAKEMPFDISIQPIAIADGGEGTVEALLSTGLYHAKTTACADPLFREISATYAIDDHGNAVIEMAQSGGLTLIPYMDGNAAITTTYGTGQQILDAVRYGARSIYVAVGGSATNDGGIGALAALGCVFLDSNGMELSPVGASLEHIARIDTSRMVDMRGVAFHVLTDVDNPLVGAHGATYCYGAQKGAVGEVMRELEQGMCHYADIVEAITSVRLHDMRGAGAAGGLAGGLCAFLGADIHSGIQTVLQLLHFEYVLHDATAVVTGEGRLDSQSLHGKAIGGVCSFAQRVGIPVYALVGCSDITADEAQRLGLRGVTALTDFAPTREDSMRYAEQYALLGAQSTLNTILRDIGEE